MKEAILVLGTVIHEATYPLGVYSSIKEAKEALKNYRGKDNYDHIEFTTVELDSEMGVIF